MSTTLSEAIDKCKERISDAYTAIVAKGGTLPATQDSANLPSAIASIPSGDDFGEGFIYNNTARVMKLLGGNNSGITEINDIDSAITKWEGGTAFRINELEKIHLPALTMLPLGAFCESPNLVELNLPNVTTINSNSSYPAFRSIKVEKLYLPNLTVITGAGGFSFQFFAGEEADFPSLTDCSFGVFFEKSTMIKKINIPNIKNLLTNYGYFELCPNLIDIICGRNFSGNSNQLRSWSPTNALNASSSSLIEPDETFANNREKLLYNIREHIAANLPTITDGYSITFSAAVKSAILSDQPAADAFTNKGWVIA